MSGRRNEARVREGRPDRDRDPLLVAVGVGGRKDGRKG